MYSAKPVGVQGSEAEVNLAISIAIANMPVASGRLIVPEVIVSDSCMHCQAFTFACPPKIRYNNIVINKIKTVDISRSYYL
jgi:hypothetical protein